MEEQLFTKKEARANATKSIFVSAPRFIVIYSVALGIWGLALNKGFLWFGLSGAIIGILVSLLSIAPVIAIKRTQEQIKETMFAAGAIWGGIGIFIGVAGIILWIVRVMFF